MPDDSPATDGAKATTGLASYALVIGIDAYGGGIATLQSAVRDATAIGALLANDHQYHVTCLVDEAATRRAILQFLDALPATLTADSAFLLYYAGHGVAHGDGTAGPQGSSVCRAGICSSCWTVASPVRSAGHRLARSRSSTVHSTRVSTPAISRVTPGRR